MQKLFCILIVENSKFGGYVGNSYLGFLVSRHTPHIMLLS